MGADILDLETRGGRSASCSTPPASHYRRVTETVVGFENHSGLTRLGPGCEAFGRIIAGAGNNGEDGSRRALAERLRHVSARSVPAQESWLTDQLIRIAVGRAEECLRPTSP